MDENILGERALKIAITQIGVREVGNTNSGKEVDQYLKSVGLPGGFSWCMAFVYWCYQKAATELKIKNPLVRTAGVLNEWEKIDGKEIPGNGIDDDGDGWIDETNRVSPGDAIKNNSLVPRGSVVIIDHGAGKGHTALVERIYGGFVDTIEGNTNDEGSREGYEVCRRTRKIATIKGFIVPTTIHI